MQWNSHWEWHKAITDAFIGFLVMWSKYSLLHSLLLLERSGCLFLNQYVIYININSFHIFSINMLKDFYQLCVDCRNALHITNLLVRSVFGYVLALVIPSNDLHCSIHAHTAATPYPASRSMSRSMTMARSSCLATTTTCSSTLGHLLHAVWSPVCLVFITLKISQWDLNTLYFKPSEAI